MRRNVPKRPVHPHGDVEGVPNQEQRGPREAEHDGVGDHQRHQRVDACVLPVLLVAHAAPRTGSVTATQRFGSDDRRSFRRVVPHTEDIERLDDTQAVIQQASLLGQAALGERAGKRARRVQVLGAKELALPPRCANFGGYSLHAGVGFKARDRAGLERLCRYILRPPLAKDRLQRRDDGNVVVGLERVWSDGTSALEFSPSELVERLVALVPPPRANQLIYRGVVAANAAWRAEVVPRPPAETSEAAQARRAKRLTRH